MSKLLVYFECAPEHFGTLMGAIGPNMAVVENLRVEANGKNPRTIRSKEVTKQAVHIYQNSRVQQIILESLKEAHPRRLTYAELGAKLAEKDFSPNSVSPAVSYLMRGGFVTRNNGSACWVPQEPT